MDSRRSFRRKTLAQVTPVEGLPKTKKVLVTDISLEGAYLKTADRPPVGSQVTVNILLPTGSKHPMRVTGRVVRTDEEGVGLRFEDLHSRDRNRLREYAGFVEMDDAVVALQHAMNDVLAGNLLPVNDGSLIEERLKSAADRGTQILVALSVKKGPWINARLGFQSNQLQLRSLDRPIPENDRVVYYAVLDGPLQAVFEGLVVEHGEQPGLLLPQRMYHNDRRCSRRLPAENTWASFVTSHENGGAIQMPVMDTSQGGCSILVPKNSLIAVGMRFPVIEISDGCSTDRHDGATVTRIVPSDQPDSWLVGLNFLDIPQGRDAFAQIQNRSVESSSWSNLKRMAGVTWKKVTDLLGRRETIERKQVYVCRYKNTHRESVAGILDATFDLHDTPPPVDVAVMICQPFQVRKEVFGLLARTLVDNFKRDGINGVVLRFDLTHMIGESETDPELEAKGRYFYNWTYSQYESDMIGSLSFLDRRFRPKSRVAVTLSVASIPARRMIADGEKPGVDLWIAPFGCPDGQDQFKNYMAGEDLFQKFVDGEEIKPIYVYGRLGDPNGIIRDAIQRGMAFLDDARNDLSKIQIPIGWIVGTYDYIVTRERVRQMLNAPGGGLREIIELPAGHLLKTGPEAIESYKLVSEMIAKHMYRSDRPAVEPDMARFIRQNEAEWARVKRTRIQDEVEFWDRHLFGDSGDVEGYDVFLYNPEYLELMRRQAELLDVQADDKVADLGCGTGNLILALLDMISTEGKSVSLTCCDLVPKAVQRTKEKVEAKIRQANGRLDGVKLDCRVMDLEAARLAPLSDFLSGRLYGPVALAGRIEGLETQTLRKLATDYGPQLHDILHGEFATIKEIIGLCPTLDETEAATVLELSRASRFLKDKMISSDLRPGLREAKLASDLAFEHLRFGQVTRDCRLDCPPESFNKICSSIVLPYLYDPESVVREFYRILAPGGVIVLSSPKPNFDSSKSYLTEANNISTNAKLDSQQKERLLRSLRELAAFVSHVLELEDEGRFRFFTSDELSDMLLRAGFEDVSTHEALGDPPTATIVRATKGADERTTIRD